MTGTFMSVPGCRLVAEFQGVTDTSARDQITRDAFERVRYLLEKLGLEWSSTSDGPTHAQP